MSKLVPILPDIDRIREEVQEFYGWHGFPWLDEFTFIPVTIDERVKSEEVRARLLKYPLELLLGHLDGDPIHAGCRYPSENVYRFRGCLGPFSGSVPIEKIEFVGPFRKLASNTTRFKTGSLATLVHILAKIALVLKGVTKAAPLAAELWNRDFDLQCNEIFTTLGDKSTRSKHDEANRVLKLRVGHPNASNNASEKAGRHGRNGEEQKRTQNRKERGQPGMANSERNKSQRANTETASSEAFKTLAKVFSTPRGTGPLNSDKESIISSYVKMEEAQESQQEQLQVKRQKLNEIREKKRTLVKKLEEMKAKEANLKESIQTAEGEVGTRSQKMEHLLSNMNGKDGFELGKRLMGRRKRGQ